jgi:N-acetylmuramoyl-L-alanine amidase
MRRTAALLLILLMTLLFCLPVSAEETAKKKVAKKTAAKKVKKSTSKKSAAKKSEQKAAAPLLATVPQKVLLTELKHWSNPDYTRIAVTLNHEASFEKHEIAVTPGSAVLNRIFFDINGAKLTSGVRDITVGDGLLKAVRVAQYKADTVRVVLDVENIKDYKIFTFADPFRIIVDVKGERQASISALTPSIATLPLPAPESAQKEPVKPAPEQVIAPLPAKIASRAPLKGGKVRRIVVDPGHGGKDPGAVGQSGLQEKDVVLAIGLSLARKLKDELGIDVVMTRSTDVFIELQERTAIANKVGADLFVSVHANAALNRNASGMETYYLNLAKTEKAAQLAARENGTSLEKVSLLQAVLFDLMANYKLNDSAHLAEEVQKALYKKISGRHPSTRNLGVKQGPLYVLVGATMPSILVESAFISNPQEEARLADPHFQEQVADGIVDGIYAYISSLK